MNTKQIDHEIRLAKRIEAGLLAQEIIDSGVESLLATTDELLVLVDEGKKAKDDLILAHLGLIRVIAVEAATRGGESAADLFQEGCVATQQAIMNYDWRKGSFGPYAAMWIRAAVRRITTRTWVDIDQVEVADPVGEYRVEHAITHEGLARVLSLIPPAQSKVLRMRTGWDGQPLTRRDVACELGMTISKVRHLEQVGLRSVREHWETAEAA